MKLNIYIRYDGKFLICTTDFSDVDGIAIIGEDGDHLFEIKTYVPTLDTIVIQSSIRGVGLSVCPVSNNAVSIRNDM